MGDTAPKTNGSEPHSNGQTSRPLKILIAGAGIGGLFAAISLASAGHSITIYESSRFAVETGAAIHLPPNVNGLLRRYNILPESFGAVTCEWLNSLKPDGSTTFLSDLRGLKHAYPYPWQLAHRIDLHNALKEKAKSLGVEIKLQSRVKGVDFDNTELILESGERVQGDLVIGADGVHSVIRNLVLGSEVSPKPSGTSAYRFLIPISVIKEDPRTAPLVERAGEMIMVYGDERRLVSYPCRNNTELNFVAMIPDYESGAEDNAGWNQAGSKAVLLKLFDSFADQFKALLEKAPEDTVKLWKLLDLDTLPTWSKGNVVLVGDAAHPFLPHQGQGGAQAMEDGAALGALLPLGTLPSEIPSRLKLYFSCRFERATLVQNYTRDSGMKIKGFDHVKKVDMNPLQFSAYSFKHDAFDNAAEALKNETEATTS